MADLDTSELIRLAKNNDETIMQYIPEGMNPATYVRLVEGLMGRDKNNNLRPGVDMMTFLHVAKKTGLDPMSRQIYAIYRWDSSLGREKMTIQTGIDGLRLIAQRSGQYAGQEKTIFDPADMKAPHPETAEVTVLKNIGGQIVKTTAVAIWGECVQTTKDGAAMGLWGSKPYTMLEKVAEAKALRKAFPAETSGIYATEEMTDDVRKEIPTYKPAEIKSSSSLEVEVDEDKL